MKTAKKKIEQGTPWVLEKDFDGQSLHWTEITAHPGFSNDYKLAAKFNSKEEAQKYALDHVNILGDVKAVEHKAS